MLVMSMRSMLHTEKLNVRRNRMATTMKFSQRPRSFSISSLGRRGVEQTWGD